jgi:succinate dehydrogenase / fumarate reductase membrane anchor subunit
MLGSLRKTDLGRVRHLGSAHGGTGHFWLQRMTAVSNLFLVTAVLVLLVSLSGAGHAEIVARLRHPFVVLLLLLAVGSVAVHMRLGMQVIIEDYVHHEGYKLIALIASTFYVGVVALTCAFAVLKIGFGG